MKHLKLSQLFAVLALAITLAPCTASAQEADTLSISATFRPAQYTGTIGADLAAVFADGNEHWWSLTLYGVTYLHDYSYYEWNDEWSSGYDEAFITRVHATSFDFQFFGPDADVLNQVVSQQLIRGRLRDDGFLDLVNFDYFDSADPIISGRYGAWNFGLLPLDPAVGVSFSAENSWLYPFSTDENRYPVVEPQRVTSGRTSIRDFRPGNSGALVSTLDAVDIGSSAPPLPPSLKIQDASVLEGDKGASRLDMMVTLSWISRDAVTVNYQTVSSTALATKDYTATSGTLTFQPGQTSRPIPIAIKGDRKREADETFSVRLSGAVGATINDAVATATILNDD